MAFEQTCPMLRPVTHLGADAVSQIRLRRLKICESPFFFRMELIPDKSALIGFEPEYGGVADFRAFSEPGFVSGEPIVDDRNPIRLVSEKMIQ